MQNYYRVPKMLDAGYHPVAHRIYGGRSIDELKPETLIINKLFQNNGYDIT